MLQRIHKLLIYKIAYYGLIKLKCIYFERFFLMAIALIIQDQQLILNDLSIILTLQGFQTHTASNGIHGLQLMDKIKPDIIITDYRMPGMFGWEVANQVLSLTNFDIPVILISATDPTYEINDYLALFDAFLPMPFEISDFLDIVTSFSNKNPSLSVIM